MSELFSSFFLLFEFQCILTRFFVWLCQSLFESFRCSIFKDRFAPLPQQRSTSISHAFPFVNTFFRNFFDFFRFVYFWQLRLAISIFSYIFCTTVLALFAVFNTFRLDFDFQNPLFCIGFSKKFFCFLEILFWFLSINQHCLPTKIAL